VKLRFSSSFSVLAVTSRERRIVVGRSTARVFIDEDRFP